MLELHSLGSKHGPIGGTNPKPGCVEGAIGAALNGAAYMCEGDDSVDPLQVAGFLLRSLAKNHCFEDGNKRVAWLSALEVLGTSLPITIDCDEETAAEFVERVATDNLPVEDIISWLSERLAPENFNLH